MRIPLQHSRQGDVQAELRPTRADDATIWAQSWQPTLRRHGRPDGEWPWAAHIARAESDDGYLCLAIARDGALDALMSLTEKLVKSRLDPDRTVVYIEYVGVAPENQSSPIGSGPRHAGSLRSRRSNTTAKTASANQDRQSTGAPRAAPASASDRALVGRNREIASIGAGSRDGRIHRPPAYAMTRSRFAIGRAALRRTRDRARPRVMRRARPPRAGRCPRRPRAAGSGHRSWRLRSLSERCRRGGEEGGRDDPRPEADGRADRKRPEVRLPRRGAIDCDPDPELEEGHTDHRKPGEGRHPHSGRPARTGRDEEQEEHRRQDQRRHQVGGVANELDRHRPGVGEREPQSLPARTSSASSSVSGRTSSSASGTPARTRRSTVAPPSDGGRSEIRAVALAAVHLELRGPLGSAPCVIPASAFTWSTVPVGDHPPALDQHDTVGQRARPRPGDGWSSSTAPPSARCVASRPRQPSARRCRGRSSARRHCEPRGCRRGKRHAEPSALAARDRRSVAQSPPPESLAQPGSKGVS